MADAIDLSPDDIKPEEIALEPADIGKPSKPASVGGAAKQFLYGINRAIGSPIEGAEDIAAGNVEFAGHRIPVPWATGKPSDRTASQWWKRTFAPSDPTNASERVMSEAGEMIPSTIAQEALQGGPIGALATQAVKAGMKGFLPRTLAASREAMATAPVSTLATDTALGALSGASGQAYDELSPSPTTGGRMAAELAPAPALGVYSKVSPTMLGAKFLGIPAIKRGAEVAAEYVTPGMLARFPSIAKAKANLQADRYDRAIRTVASDFSGLTDDEMQRRLAEAEELTRRIGSQFKPTLGEATDLASAKTTQRDIERSATGTDLDELSGRQRGSYGAVDDYLNARGPAPLGTTPEMAEATPGVVAQRMVDREKGAVAQDLERVGQAESQVITQGLPEADRFAAGTALRDRFDTLKTATSKRMSQMFDDLVPEENKFVPFAKLQSRIADLKPSMFADTSDLGPTVKKIMDWTRASGERPTFADVKYLTESLGDEQRAAQRAGNRQLARRIGQARDQVDQFLEQDWAAGLKSDVKTRWDQARKTYKEEYIDRFQTGAAREQQRLGGDNAYRTPNEDVASEYWQPGGVTSARQFKGTFGDDDVANKALYASALDDLRMKVAPNGQWNDAAYRRWLTANRDNLAEFPELKAHVSKVGDAIEAVSARRAELIARQSEIDDSTLARMLNRDPNKVAELVLSNPRSAATLAKEMSPDEKRMVGMHAWRTAVEKGNVSADKLSELLQQNREALSVWLSKDELSALDDATKAWTMLGRSAEVKGQPTDANKLAKIGEKLGTQPLQGLSRLFAVESGRTSERYTVADFLMRAAVAANGREADKIARQAIYDPKFATELAKYVSMSKGGKEPMPKPLKAYIGAVLTRPQVSDQERQSAEEQ